MENELVNIGIIIVVNLFAGFIGGQAGGAGLISLPLLMVLGLNPVIALGTLRFSAIFLNAASSIEYVKKKKVDLKKILPFLIVSMIGSVLGTYVTISIDEVLLKKIIAIVFLTLLVITLINNKVGLKDKKFQLSTKQLILFTILTFVTGIYGGFIGVATPTFFALIFIFFGQSFTKGVGYGMVLATLLSLSSTVVFILNGYVNFFYAIPLSISLALGGWLGAKYGIKRGNLWVKYVFAVMIALFIIKLFWEIYL